ncbi:uncharacterized protein LOC106165707 [Lingula anatina]|uniref:Uncharacterized protein LOC106165707 n=1 Tax=Lingula anatina TaxID=7574 RepID=A0A1S3INK0_LINAN|nr:uncharacterized protein LOC106165707 [Lingula anatina]|eukprot:XP_013399476.1 uncharacterized protein LOC106165707 [Lingula anatina]
MVNANSRKNCIPMFKLKTQQRKREYMKLALLVDLKNCNKRLGNNKDEKALLFPDDINTSFNQGLLSVNTTFKWKKEQIIEEVASRNQMLTENERAPCNEIISSLEEDAELADVAMLISQQIRENKGQ